MKKLMLILMVLGMAAPLYAAGRIQFSVTDNGNGSCTIVYDANSTFDIAPVAMGLTVKVTGGNPIKSVALEDETDFMEIYMDAAYSMEDPCGDPCTSYTYGAGDAIADPCGPGQVDLVTHGNHFVLSFGGLGGELEKTKSPPMSGSITLYADTQEAPAGKGGVVTGTIKLDARRGGVIGEDGEAMETNLDDPAKAGPMAFTISECILRDSPSYADWSGYGIPGASGIGTAGWMKPQCWCFKKHCNGDSNGRRNGLFPCGSTDLAIFLDAWGKAKIDTNDARICADWTHGRDGPFRVGSSDLAVLLAYFGKPRLQVPDCPIDFDPQGLPVPDGVTDYDFWILIDNLTGAFLGFEQIP